MSTIEQSNRRQSDFYATIAAEHGTARPDATPEWADVSTSEHDEHRQTCDTGCSWCEGHRAWGECARCGSEVEARDDELSPCCGSFVVLLGPTEDNLAALRAA